MVIYWVGFTKQFKMEEGKKQLFEGALMELGLEGITALHIYYEGSGDSGGIEYIEYTNASTKDCVEGHDYELLDGWNGGYHTDHYPLEIFKPGSRIYELVEDIAVDKVLNNQEDWWNNEGGYGSMYIDVPSGKFLVENNVRFTSVNTYNDEGNILDKM